jgi:hypothetical protein
MPRLKPDLEAQFIRYEERDGHIYHVHVDKLEEADGILFLCPKCFVENAGNLGTHAVICWFVGKVSGDVHPRPGRWVPSGTSYEDLTFVGPAAASVLLTAGCNWHGFVKQGSAD